MTISTYASLLLLILFQSASGQVLQAGFDKVEYIETLKINYKAHIATDEWGKLSAIADPQHFHFVYRSPRVAFDNIWDLWISNNKNVALIAVQGSVQTQASFLANLYAAMIPAKGELQLDKGVNFKYVVSNNPSAAVHAGWLIAMAHMAPGIVHKIDSCYKAGIKDFILTGHSQGGGITFLLNSYLESLKADGRIAKDVRFKTYCSAGPKPGNLFFAYDYENLTRGGWAYNVVNTADWVPDVPFSVQTIDDFTAVNPFRGARAMIRKQKFPRNIALRHVYNKLDKPSRRAARNYQKYLGKMVSKAVAKQLPGLQIPTYYNSSYYVRTGNTVLLYPGADYFNLFNNNPDDPNIWRHHLPKPYLYLAEQL